jgi:hypothetical protein
LNVEADRTPDNFGGVVARDEAQIAAGAVGFLAMYRDFSKRLDKAYQQNRKRYNLRRCDVRYIAGQEVFGRITLALLRLRTISRSGHPGF